MGSPRGNDTNPDHPLLYDEQDIYGELERLRSTTPAPDPHMAVLRFKNEEGTQSVKVPITEDGHTAVIHLDSHTDARIKFSNPTKIEEKLDIYKRDLKRKKNPKVTATQASNAVLGFFYTAFIVIASIITAVPTMINAGLTGFGIRASDVSLNVWRNASWLRRCWGLALIVSTGTLNFILARTSFPQAFAQIRDGKNWKENPFRSFVAALLAVAGAASLFAVAMQTLVFNLVLAWYMAVSGFFINGATRLVSANNSIKRALQYIDPKITLQNRYFGKLKKLAPEFLVKLNKSLRKTLHKLETQAEKNIDGTSNLKKNPDRFYGLLLVALDKKLSRMTEKYERSKPNLASLTELEPLNSVDPESEEDEESLKPKVNKVDNILSDDICTTSNLLSTAYFAFNVLMGLTFATTSFIVFEPKGENAINIIHPNATANLDTFERLAVGSPAGVASGSLYFLSAYDILLVFLTALYAATQSKNPTRNLILLALLSAATFLSGANMFNVSNGTAHDPKTLFAEWLKNIQTLFACLGGMGGALVNGKNALMEFFSAPVKLDFGLEDDIVAALIQVYGNTSINTNKGIDNKVGDEFLHYIQIHSQFARQHHILDSAKPNLPRARSTIFTQ